MGTKQKAKPDIIDHEYAALMSAAALVHGPVNPLAKRLGDILLALGALDIRRPNDWQFHWNGYVELRWHDGGPMFRDSTLCVSLNIMPDSLSIHGRLEKGERGYDDYGKANIRGLSDEDGMKVLRVFLSIVNKPKKEDK